MYYYYDYSWFVLLPAIIFTFITQARITSAYSNYSRIPNSRHITGGDAARRMMDANGLSDVRINILNGGNSLTNFYDPKTKSLNLSRQVYGTASIASMCIACHEVGHAIQDATHYAPLAFRNGIVPLVNLTQMAILAAYHFRPCNLSDVALRQPDVPDRSRMLPVCNPLPSCNTAG